MVSLLVLVLGMTIFLVVMVEIAAFFYKNEVKKFEQKVIIKRDYYQQKKLDETRRD